MTQSPAPAPITTCCTHHQTQEALNQQVENALSALLEINCENLFKRLQEMNIGPSAEPVTRNTEGDSNNINNQSVYPYFTVFASKLKCRLKSILLHPMYKITSPIKLDPPSAPDHMSLPCPKLDPPPNKFPFLTLSPKSQPFILLFEL